MLTRCRRPTVCARGTEKVHQQLSKSRHGGVRGAPSLTLAGLQRSCPHSPPCPPLCPSQRWSARGHRCAHHAPPTLQTWCRQTRRRGSSSLGKIDRDKSATTATRTAATATTATTATMRARPAHTVTNIFSEGVGVGGGGGGGKGEPSCITRRLRTESLWLVVPSNGGSGRHGAVQPGEHTRVPSDSQQQLAPRQHLDDGRRPAVGLRTQGKRSGSACRANQQSGSVRARLGERRGGGMWRIERLSTALSAGNEVFTS